MKKSFKRLLTSCLTLALALGGAMTSVSVHAEEAAQEPVYGGILYVSREGTFTENDLYPHMKMNTQAYITMAPAIEKLFYLNAEGEMIPQLATSWDVSDDGLTYTFHLAEGVKFHDGSDFNAEVAKWNLDMAKAAFDEYGTGTSNNAMESATVIDDHTLEVKFSSMYATLFLAMDVYMCSQKAFEENGIEWYSKNPVGTGPFVFDHWTLDSEIVYTKNEDYWVEGQPYVDGVTFKIIKQNPVLSVYFFKIEVRIPDGILKVPLPHIIDILCIRSVVPDYHMFLLFNALQRTGAASAAFTAPAHHHIRADVILNLREQADRTRRNTLFRPGKAQALFRRGLHIHLFYADAQGISNVLPHLLDMRSHLRLLGDDRRIDILNKICFLRDQLSDMGQQLQAVRPLIGRIVIREMLADISQSRCSEEGVTDRMQKHVRIRMAKKAKLMGNLHAANDQLAAFYQTMYIVSTSNSHKNPLSVIILLLSLFMIVLL